MHINHRPVFIFVALALAEACTSRPQSPAAGPEAPQVRIDPSAWPRYESPFARSDEIEARITTLLRRMSLEEKVGQIIQADINVATPREARDYHLGSILNGGNSAPERDVRVGPEAWLALADEYWEASTDGSGGRTSIPIIWGTDAVHGHNNIVGATIFPHNIGLGAANDPALIEAIGAATAKEIRATGIDWTFAPTLAVARDDRWGRTYESYSEDPEIVAKYAPAIVRGLQGTIGAEDFLGPDRVLATAKHFVGDGGTDQGRDQGDNLSSESELREVHAAGYPPAIASGVQVVMASFNTYHGRKLHGYKELLSDVLVGRMGFDGFVVGDWNGHAQLPGCSASSCASAINAGLDMFMAPRDWKALHRNTVRDVSAGRISAQRLNEAVARVLRVKIRMGLFEAPRPSLRQHAGDWRVLGDPLHKALARRAVRASLVLLKNEGGVLPVSAQSKVLIAGDAADDIASQCGGWTLSWQGTGNTNAHFPHGQSILQAVRQAVAAGGGEVTFSRDGSFDEPPDVAIVAYGESPYAEYEGDRRNVDYGPEGALRILQRLQKAGIPTVSVFVSGRPLWVNPELNASDAFVAAWLPGDQAGGIADVIVRKKDGAVNFDFTGRLSFSWPASADGVPPNRGDEGARALFPVGYGLDYEASRKVGRLSEAGEPVPVAPRKDPSMPIRSGDAGPGWRMVLRDDKGDQVVRGARARSPGERLVAVSGDDKVQEDTRIFEWSGSAKLIMTRTDDGGLRLQQAIVLRYRVPKGAIGPTRFALACGTEACGAIDVTPYLTAARDTGWQERRLSVRCFSDHAKAGERAANALAIESEGPLVIEIASIEIAQDSGDPVCDL